MIDRLMHARAQEALEKTDSAGKLLPEMVSVLDCSFWGARASDERRNILQILICQNLRNNLQHPNEYIRGVTLRFLCRIREEEILEPLIPSILANLEHRHSYVRRTAVLAVNAIYKLPRGELLLQDAPETIDKVLRSEQDMSTKRNAFAMLTNHAPEKAARYLFENIEAISTWSDILQMAILELIRKVRSCMHGMRSRRRSGRHLVQHHHISQ